MTSHSKFTVIVRAKSTEIHPGKKKRATHLYSYWVDGRQIDYYGINSSGGLKALDFDRAAVEAHYHATNQGYRVEPMKRVGRRRKKIIVLPASDSDGNKQKPLL